MSIYYPPNDVGSVFNPANFDTITANNLSDVLIAGNNAGLNQINMNSQKIILCANPTSAQDVATKNYVDSYVPASDNLANVLIAGNSAGGTQIDMNSNNIINGATFTASSFVGALTGTATNATNVAITDDNTNATFYPVFASNNTGNLPLKVDKTTNPLSYNPSTSVLTSTTFSGALSGNATSATTATTATTATNITTTSDNTSGTYYIPFSKTTAGTSTAIYLDDTTTALTYNPSTSSLSSVQYVASASGSTNTLGSSSMAISNAGGTLTLNQGSLTASTTFVINSTSGQVINLQTNGTTQSSITASGVQISLLTTQGTATYASPTLTIATTGSAPYPTMYTNLITFSGSTVAQTISTITPPTNMPINAMYMVYITNSNTSAGAITVNATSLGSGIKTTYTSNVVIPISSFALGTLTKVGASTYIWSINLVA
jgi:hypothetical protein